MDSLRIARLRFLSLGTGVKTWFTRIHVSPAQVNAASLFVKFASDDSSWLGRYLVSGVINRGRTRDFPGTYSGVSTPVSVAGGLLGRAVGSAIPVPIVQPALVATLSSLGSEATQGALAHNTDASPEAREREILERLAREKQRSIPNLMLRGAGTGALAGGVGGLLSGLLLHAYLAPSEPSAPNNLARRLIGLGGLGAVLGGTLGGAASVWDKAVLASVSEESKRRAAKMKSKRYLASALPFGDAIGAMTY